MASSPSSPRCWRTVTALTDTDTDADTDVGAGDCGSDISENTACVDLDGSALDSPNRIAGDAHWIVWNEPYLDGRITRRGKDGITVR